MHASLVHRGPVELAPIHPFVRSELIVFMSCSKCGLSVRLVSPHMPLERCPRCLVHRRQIVEMHITQALPSNRPRSVAEVRHGVERARSVPRA
jgi:hypothetical protein